MWHDTSPTHNKEGWVLILSGAGGGGGGGGVEAGQGQSYLERGGRPHHLAIVQDQGSPDGIVFVVNEELVLMACEGAHGQQELGQVVAVQCAGLGWQPTGQVCVTHTYHSLQCIPVMLSRMLLAIDSATFRLMALPAPFRLMAVPAQAHALLNCWPDKQPRKHK